MSAVSELSEGIGAVGGKSPPVMAFATDPETLETVSRVVPGGRNGVEVNEGGIANAIDTLRGRPPPALLIVDITGSSSPVSEISALAEMCGPRTTILAIGPENDVSLFRALVAAGVTDYMVKPISGQELRRTMLTANQRDGMTDQVANGLLSVVVGAHGGVGGSAVAVGAAWQIANRHKKQVGLVDLDLQFGTASLSLDLDPGSGLRSALEQPDRIDSLFVASAMVSCGDNLYVLSGEEPLDQDVQVQAASVDRLIGELKRIFDVVIIDMPRHLVATCSSVMESAHTVGLVTDLSLAGLRDSLRIRTSLETLAPEARLCIIANRVGLAKSGELAPSEFEKSLGAKIDFIIPEDPSAAKAAINGKPLAAGGSRGKVADSMKGLSRIIGGISDQKKTSGRSWFKFGR